MPHLIDGYNLLYAMGRLTPRSNRHNLESARKALLIQLVAGHGPDAGGVTVVFDAQAAPPGSPGADSHGGVRVLFSQGQTADDLIEELIRHESSPRLLTVVSDDHRIQQAARRRGCTVLGCLDYYERLQDREVRPVVTPPEPPGKPEQMSAEETQQWLDVFKDADEQGPR
jgi:predicted RNA-binding protein with PIN domain